MTRNAIVEYLSGARRAVEIGIGKRDDVAKALAESGVDVTATDVHERPVPSDVRFVRDDVTDPTPSVYADADLLYALNLPPELQRPAWTVAREHDARFVFTTLGGDPATIPVSRTTVPGETLFEAMPERP
ncbi:UPF0146 family protein [Haloarculaceae archaeon H-GB2-1]|nr:UPF0146 family protein [Haloarculaceae archaeon H-GB1-1]MEA5406725.1 UPF0146 family protein [Haloarculaceae archaeon H-GB2-1]